MSDLTPEQQNRMNCRSLAAQLATAFDAMTIEDQAAAIYLRPALDRCLTKDCNAPLALLVLQNDTALSSQIKAPLLALFD